MRMDRFTTLAQQTLADAQSQALSAGHAELSPLHILAALLEDRTSIAHSIIGKAGVNADRVAEVAEAELKRLPTVSGESAQPQTSPAAIGVLTEAEKRVHLH